MISYLTSLEYSISTEYDMIYMIISVVADDNYSENTN